MTDQLIPPCGGPVTSAPESDTAAGRPRLTFGYATDLGLRRELNEDSLLASEPIFAVADGMGGHEAGEIASGVCVRTLGRGVSGARAAGFSAEDLEQLIADADAEIRAETGGKAGTTLSGVVIVQEAGAPSWLCFNVGDSRTYRLSGDRFGQVSVDHSEVQELVELGEITAAEAQTHPRRHVVTRALGTGDDAEADYWLMPVRTGDRILVCSDGLSGEVDDDDIYEVLTTVPDPQAAADALIEATLRSGARDNVTVIVLDAVLDEAPDAASRGADVDAAGRGADAAGAGRGADANAAGWGADAAGQGAADVAGLSGATAVGRRAQPSPGTPRRVMIEADRPPA